jgi:hypothetical protein
MHHRLCKQSMAPATPQPIASLILASLVDRLPTSIHPLALPPSPHDPPCASCRVEPLAQPSSEVQRAPFVPLYKGGKRIHLAVQARCLCCAEGAGQHRLLAVTAAPSHEGHRLKKPERIDHSVNQPC